MEDSTGKSGKYLDDFGLNYFWSKLKNLFSKKTNILDPENIVRKDDDTVSIWSSKVTWEFEKGKYSYTDYPGGGIIQLFTITNLNKGSFHYRAYYQSGLVRDGSIIIEVCSDYYVVNSNKTVNTIFNIGDVPFVFNTTTNSVGLLEYSYNGDVDRKIYKIEGWFNLHTVSQAGIYLQSAIAPRQTSLSNYSGATLYLDNIGDLSNIDNYVDIPYHNLEGNNNPKVVYTFGDQTISGTKTFDYQSKIVVNGGATTTFNNTPTFTGGVVEFSAPPEYINGHIGASKDSHCFVTSGGLYDAIEGLQSGDIAGKQDTITGAASTAVSDNFTASRAVISNSSGKLGVSNVTSTELGYLDGVTSNVQTQLNGKQASITGGASTITSSNLTVSRALVSSSSGKVAVSDVTSTELGYLDGVTSNVQTQLNGKAATSSLTNGSVTKVGTATKGSSTQPIYLSGGSPTTCSTYAGGTCLTLNGTSKASTTASFYAPTTAGTGDYILTSNGSGAPSWKNSINVDAANFNVIELNRNGSSSVGHGGYIDFHYNATQEDYSSRIVDWSNRLAVMGKLLIQDGGVKYLGAGDDYTLTNTDNICFIRSDAKNNITVPAGSGITNRHLYALSMIAGSTLTYRTYRTSDFTIADVSLIMRPGKVYHLVAYDANTWYLMNDVDNDHNGKTISVTTSSTLTDNYATKAKLSNGVTFSLSDATAYEGREILVYCNSTGATPTVRWQVPAGANTYNSITLSDFYCIKFIAIDGHWMPLQSSNI